MSDNPTLKCPLCGRLPEAKDHHFCPIDGSMYKEMPSDIWPKYIELYINDSDESLWSTGERLGLKGDDALSMFSHCLNEYKLLLEVSSSGTTRIVAIDDQLVDWDHDVSDTSIGITKIR